MRITTITSGQSKEAAAVAAAAFADDPIWRHTLPSTRRRRLPHTILLRASLRWMPPDQAALVARVAERDGRIVGLATWHRLGQDQPAGPGDPRLVRAARRLVRRVGNDRRRLAAMYAALDESTPRDPGWFLGTLVVHPDHQGTGVGSALLRDGLARMDRAGLSVSLQTSTDDNVRFYRRHGFEVTETRAELYPEAPPIWTMRRAASTSHQT